ncbi:hypothetical protein DPMN_146653 [Dreissena polymorpha]|uniref:Uncharacterized protein n=1 Tax=Dreissena polymorpha TaxID=45954 RepID=A0A9D4F6Y6_DREPO|nr:hypothetical protein DPMN_146653 [Dreissena polymorpha]
MEQSQLHSRILHSNTTRNTNIQDFVPDCVSCIPHLVVGVGVSPDGKRIYVTDRIDDKLLTLTRDGTVTATLHDHAFRHGCSTDNIHVAATGQVFVFGNNSISQVDTVGKTIINTIFVDIEKPTSVYFIEETRKLIVGFWIHDNINEFKTKTVPTF